MQKNRDAQFTVRCDDDMSAEIKLCADLAGQSTVEWIRRAIRKELEYQKIKNSPNSSFEDLKKQILLILDDPDFKYQVNKKLKDKDD